MKFIIQFVIQLIQVGLIRVGVIQVGLIQVGPFRQKYRIDRFLNDVARHKGIPEEKEMG